MARTALRPSGFSVFKIIMAKEKASGIYKVTNLINQKCYIGKAKDIHHRFWSHKNNSKKETPDRRSSPLLYHAINKYGLDNFSFEIIEVLPLEEDLLKNREIFWMDFYDSYSNCCGYNLRRDSDTHLIVHPTTLEKMSANLREQWANGVRDGHGAKLAKSWGK